MIRDLKIASHDFVVKILVILSFERKLSTEKGVEQHPRCIDISWWPTKLSLPNNFWSHVGRRTTEDLDPLIIWYTCRKAKVYEFDLPPLIQHDVLKFDVSVGDALRMEILQSIHELSVYSPSFLFRHASMGFALQESVS